MSTATVTTCKAKDPTTCPYHGNVLKMQAAKAEFRFDDYADAREVLRRELATNQFARDEQQRDAAVGVDAPVTFDAVAEEQTSLDQRVRREENSSVRRPTPVRSRRRFVPRHSLDVPASHRYPEPVKQPIPNTDPSSWVGSKYDPRMAPSEITTNIKRDFALAQRAGYLPPGLSVSAQKDMYSGGYGINVEVSGAKDADRYEYDTHGEIVGDSAAAKLVNSRIQGIVDAYNIYRRQNMFDDYGMHNFGGSVNLLDDRMQALNAAQKARDARLRRSKKSQQQLREDYHRDGATALQEWGFAITGQTADGKPVGRIPGTSFVGIVDHSPQLNRDVYRVFNLHGLDEAEPNAFEANFALMRASQIRARFRKQTFIG